MLNENFESNLSVEDDRLLFCSAIANSKNYIHRMEIIGIILLLIILFVVFGLLGWMLKLGGYVFEFLWSGCSSSLGCFVWIIIVIVLLLGLAA